MRKNLPSNIYLVFNVILHFPKQPTILIWSLCTGICLWGLLYVQAFHIKKLLLKTLYSEDHAPSEMMCYSQLFIAKVYKQVLHFSQLVDCSMGVGHYFSTRAGCLTLLLWIFKKQRQSAKQPNLISNLLHNPNYYRNKSLCTLLCVCAGLA